MKWSIYEQCRLFRLITSHISLDVCYWAVSISVLLSNRSIYQPVYRVKLWWITTLIWIAKLMRWLAYMSGYPLLTDWISVSTREFCVPIEQLKGHSVILAKQSRTNKFSHNQTISISSCSGKISYSHPSKSYQSISVHLSADLLGSFLKLCKGD